MKTESELFSLAEAQDVLNPRYVIAINFHNDNLVPDPTFIEKESGTDDYWPNHNQTTYNEVDGAIAQTVAANSNINDVTNTKWIPTVPNEVFNISVKVFVSNDYDGSFGIGTTTYDESKSSLPSWPSLTKSHSSVTKGEWVTLEGVVTMSHVDTAFFKVRTTVRSDATTGTVSFRDCKLTRQSDSHETDGDVTYVTSHSDCLLPEGVKDIDVIHGCIKSITGQTQSISPDKAQHTIGNINIQLVDSNDAITDKLNAKIKSGFGLRQKQIKLYKGHTSFTEWDDYSLRFTNQIENIKTGDGLYTFSSADIQRQTKTTIFTPHQGVLTETVSDTANLIPITIYNPSEKFPLVAHDSTFESQPNSKVGYIKIDDEIICHNGWNETYTALKVVKRAALGTKEAEHTVEEGTDDDKKKQVDESIYLHMAVPKMIYAILTGVLYGQDETLPEHWHLNVNPNFVELNDYLTIGDDLWNPSTNEGRTARFIELAESKGKDFIEKELLLWLGAFSPVYANGKIGLKKLNPVLPYSGHSATLDANQIISYSDVTYNQNSVLNKIEIKWNWLESSERFTKSTVLIDSESAEKYQAAAPRTYEFKGVFVGVHSDEDIQQYFTQIRNRYAEPPLTLSIKVLPKWDKLEVGDTVRVDLTGIKDFYAGTSLSRVFEVQQIRTDWITGEVSLSLFGGVNVASLSPISSTSVMQDSYYTATGTDLDNELSITSGSLNTSATINGTSNHTTSIYYYDGDLVIPQNKTLTLTGNVQLRIKGSLQVDGLITTQGGGMSGGTGGSGVTLTYPGQNDLSK